MNINHTVVYLFIVLLLAACTANPADNPQPTQPAQIAEQSSPTPPLPTETPVPTKTPLPTATPTAIPTPTATAVPLTILEPAPEAALTAGADLTIRGIDETAVTDTLQISVAIGDWLLAEGETAVFPDGSWELTLPLPPQISGPATITVQSTAAQNSRSALIHIQPDTGPNNRYVLLNAPELGQTAVAGYGIFFNGEVNKPISRTLVIGILHDNCTRFAAGQTFELGSGQWEGLLVIPSDITGPVCAIARSGDPEESEEWMASLIPLTILAQDDENATSITLGNPGELIFSGSEDLALYGTAVNAPLNKIDLLLTSDDGTYKRLANETVDVNSYGYWEIDLTLSENYTGHALLTAGMGNDDDYYELRVPMLFTR